MRSRFSVLVALLSCALILASQPVIQAGAATKAIASVTPTVASARASVGLKGSSAVPTLVNVSRLPKVASPPKTARPAAGKSRLRVSNPAALAAAKISPAGRTGVQVGQQVSPRVDLTFTGIDSFSESAIQGGPVEPPDTQMAVGSSQIVEMVNQTGQVYGKNSPNSKVLTNFSLFTFFGMSSVDATYIATDPRILYDQSVDRWYATMVGYNLTTFDSTVFLAVSETGDATGTWAVYSVNHDANYLCDQPKLGYSDDKFVIACTDYDVYGTDFGGVLIVASKAQALAHMTMAFYASAPDVAIFAPTPAQNLSTGTTAYLIENQAPVPAATLWTVTGDPAAATAPGVSPVTFTPSNLLMAATAIPPNAEQRDSATQIDTGDNRFMSAVVLNGELSTSAAEACTPAGDTVVRSCMRVLQIGVSTPSLDQSTTAGLNGKDIYYPTLSVTASGDAAIVYGMSSATDYPGVFATQQLASHSGLFFGGGPIRVGTQPYTGIRWGDYGAAATDLANPGVIWVGGEWSTATGAPVGWSTGFGRIQNWTPPTVPSPPTAVSATPGDAQVSLTWTAPTNNGDTAITGYRVTPYDPAGAQTPIETGSTDTSYDVLGLTNGTAYTFAVAAINGVGTGADSSPSNSVTPTTFPGAPTGVVGTPGNGQVALAWIMPASIGGSSIIGYRVTTFIGSTAQGSTLTGLTAVQYTVTGLSNGTTYTFTVAAINNSGTGPDSTPSSPVTTFNAIGPVTANPTSLNFYGQAPASSSSAQTVTLQNNSNLTIHVGTVAVGGSGSSQYAKGADACSSHPIAPGDSCSVQVSFKPTGFGGFPATLSFTDDGPGSPQTVSLGGLGAGDNAAHLYTLDGYGGLHPDGTAPALASGAYWPGWNIARSFALFPDGRGGYLMDGYGGLHSIGNASPIAGFAYWAGWDIARQVVLAPWSSQTNPAGWTLDGYGGIHPFGGAPAISGASYFGWDIARGMVILPDSTSGSVAGYTLDGFGGIHPFGGAPAVANGPYWRGWDIARGISLSANASKTNAAGWVLDGYGGLHAFGSAPAYHNSPYWGWDIGRGIVTWTGSGGGGWVLDGWGGLHPFGSAPTISGFAYWPGWDIATSLAGANFGSGSKRRTGRK
jgi:hypothetical protein